MKVTAETNRESFYLENLSRLLFNERILSHLDIRASHCNTDNEINYTVILNNGIIEYKGNAKVDISRHFGYGKAQLVAIGNAIFSAAEKIRSNTTPYGILTGVRPVKMALYYMQNSLSPEETKSLLTHDYLMDAEKAELLVRLAETELERAKDIDNNDFFLYISVPFCPSRCHYCSFISQSSANELSSIPEYVFCLKKEIIAISKIVSLKGKHLRALYFGGGTPSSLSSLQLKDIIDTIYNSFDTSRMIEFTVECGRPDTIDSEKLDVLKNAGVSRISINTQTTSDELLEKIGRKHTSDDFFRAFEDARSSGIEVINSDVIAGLDYDTLPGFRKTIDDILKLNPENFTVHSLYRKRAADRTLYGSSHECSSQDAKEMIDYSFHCCIKKGYLPYYLYRQKGTIGNLENLGWTKPKHECLYNIGMMEDIATVISCGAGGVSKIYKPLDYRLLVNPQPDYQPMKRFSFYKYPSEYIKFFDTIGNTLSEIEKAL